MGADASLVNMAYKAAAANKPGDWSNSFNVQYEGLVAAHRKQAGIITKGFKGIAAIGKSVKGRQEGDLEDIEDLDIGDIYEVGSAIDNLGREKANDDIKNMHKGYENGGGSNIGEQDSAEKTMLEYKDELEVYANKTFLSKEDKKNQSNLLKKAKKFKDKLINSKGLKRTIVGAYAANDVNLKKTFGGDGEKAMALKQILDPDSNWEQLGIEAAWENGEKYYYYTPGRLKAEYDANQDSVKDVYGFVDQLIKDETKIRVSEKELFGGVVMKDKQTEVANKDIIINIKDFVKTHNTFSGEDEEGNKTGAFSLEETTRDGFRQNFMNAEGGSRNAVIDFASRGLYGRSYSDDLKGGIGEDLKGGISISTYENLLKGIWGTPDYDMSSIVNSMDKNNDGKISDIEATKIPQEDINSIHRILTNPKDDAEAKFAIEEASNYLTDLTRQEFNKQKGMTEKKDTPKYQQIGSIEWERYQNSLNKDPNTDKVTNRGEAFQLFTGLDENKEKKYQKTETSTVELISKDNQLSELQNLNKSSFDNESYVDIFGYKVGYFPGKGFAPVKIREDGQLTRKQIKSTSTPEGGYWKTPKDVFKHYSIPTMNSKKQYYEGQKEKHQDGRPIIFKGGKWVYND